MIERFISNDSLTLHHLKKILFISFYFLTGLLFAQKKDNDSIPFEMFKNDVVLFTDLGFYSAPFSLKDNYQLGVSKLKYRNNPKLVAGLGFSYKWFAFRFGLALPVNLKSEEKFNETSYFDIGFRFSLKQTFTAIEFRNYKGYVIKDADSWNDSLKTNGISNLHQDNATSLSVSANVWWFKDKEFNYQAAMGKVGHYTGQGKTWYFKSTLNFFGVSNLNDPLIPVELQDSSDRVRANGVGALDIGFIPGYAYVNRIKNWQFSVLGGLGGVIQAKYYSKEGETRSFLGVAPRIDLRLMVGYSRPKYFILLSSDFDIKSINIQDLSYNQSYYNVRLTGGFRIKTKEKKTKQKDLSSQESTIHSLIGQDL